jgi:tetratricopeptide (TPR) repeat protein
MQLLTIEHFITGAVAAACVALALAEGAFEPTAFAAAGLIAWTASVVGLATGALPRSRPPGVAIAAGLCLGGFAALIALSMIWASDDGRAFEDVVRALAYLGVFVLVVVASRRGESRPWLAGLALGLVAVGAVALLARFEPGPFGNPDEEIGATLPAALGRLTYPIGYWNGLAAAMAAAVALLAWFGSEGRSSLIRALAVGSLPLAMLALWATDSRGGIIAAVLALAVLVAVVRARTRLLASFGLGLAGGIGLVAIAHGREQLFDQPGSRLALEQGDLMLVLTIGVLAATGLARYALDPELGRLRVSRIAGRAVAVAAAVAVLVAIVAADPVQRFEDFKQPPAGTELAEGGSDLLRGGGSGRYQFWEAATDAFAEAPVAGLGSSDYGPYWLANRDVPLVATRAHSLLFETVAELGIIGLALIGGFFGIAAVSAIRRILAPDPNPELGPALAVLVVGLAVATVDWTWDLPAVLVVTVIAAALLTGTATMAPGPSEPGGVFGTVSSRRRFAGGVAVLLVAWFAICASGLLLLADHTLETSREKAADGDLEGAIAAANDAIDMQPWAAEPRTQLALLFERGGDFPAAREAIAEAIERDSHDFELQLLAARFAFEDGDATAAGAYAERARELNPLDQQLRDSAS